MKPFSRKHTGTLANISRSSTADEPICSIEIQQRECSGTPFFCYRHIVSQFLLIAYNTLILQQHFQIAVIPYALQIHYRGFPHLLLHITSRPGAHAPALVNGTARRKF
jgi:hypothetical protein